MAVKIANRVPNPHHGIRYGHARVYLDPEPENGSHPGYRGPLEADAVGVHLGTDCEWLTFNCDHDHDRFNTDWIPLTTAVTIPWARIHSVGWQEEPDV